jgi:hypothetical protein
MKRLLFKGLGVLIFFVLFFIIYLVATTKNHSPAEKVVLDVAGAEVMVTYSRPFKKGRLIFGEKEEGALLPYGQYWRTGANEATEITFSKPVNIQGNTLPAGRYRFYTYPGKEVWKVVFNSELGKWGYWSPDTMLDVLAVEVPAKTTGYVVEQFTITIESKEEGAYFISLSWDQTLVEIPFTFAE